MYALIDTSNQMLEDSTSDTEGEIRVLRVKKSPAAPPHLHIRARGST
jgi:hypothetical protein